MQPASQPRRPPEQMGKGAFVRTLLEICPAFVVACDAQGRIRRCNRGALQLTGYTRGELAGRDLLELLPADERQAMRRRMRRLASAPRLLRWQSRILARNGGELYLEGTAKATGAGAGRPALLLLVGCDVTPRRKAQQALRDSEQIFHSVVENMYGSLVIIDERLRVLYANPQAGGLFGRCSAELAGWELEKVLRLVFDARSCQRLLGRAGRRLAGARVPGSYTIRTVFRGREIRWFKLRVALLPAGGTAQRIVAQFVDITEQLRALGELMRSERRYRAVVETAPIGILTVERGGRIVQANRRLAEILGAPAAPALRELKAAELGFAGELEECFRSGKTAVFEHSCRSRWGRHCQLRLQLAPLRAKRGRVQQVQAIVEDIGEQKALEAVLAQSRKLEALSTLTGGIAHEFNNLLQVIQGHAEMLRQESAQEPEGLREICRATQRASELTSQLLAFGGLQDGERKPLDLNEEVRATVRLLERSLLKHVRVELRLAGGLPPVAGDAAQLRQALTNIALNAAQLLEERGWLRIETLPRCLPRPSGNARPQPPDRWILLRISDNGPGIAATDLQSIFDPFYTTKVAGRGVGLGLSVAYGIIRRHQGHIECRSQPGQGTSFDILLPADGRAAPSEAPRRQAAEPFRLLLQGRQTVLLVGEEPAVCRLASDFLSGAGYESLSCSRPDEALQLFAQKSAAVDLVILDGLLPQSGAELLRGLLALKPAQKVLVASGSTPAPLPGAPPGGLPAGAAGGFLRKPFKLTELLAAVREALEKAEAAGADGPAG